MIMDRGTLIRTITLGVVLLNQALVNFGLEPIPGTSESWYQILSTLATIVVAGVTWFKNNYITYRGIQQKEILVKNGLAKK